MSQDPWLLFAAWFAVQLLQTVQIALVGRKVTRTLLPPPMPPSAASYCRNCGSLTQTSSLIDGLCSHCVGTRPTQRAR